MKPICPVLIFLLSSVFTLAQPQGIPLSPTPAQPVPLPDLPSMNPPSVQAIPAPGYPRRAVRGADRVEERLNDNYVIHLEGFKDGGKTIDLKLVTSNSTFQMNIGRPSLNFTGELILLEDGRVRISYNLGVSQNYQERIGNQSSSGQYQNGWSSKVLLRPGKPVTIMSYGKESYKLTVDKLKEDDGSKVEEEK